MRYKSTFFGIHFENVVFCWFGEIHDAPETALRCTEDRGVNIVVLAGT